MKQLVFLFWDLFQLFYYLSALKWVHGVLVIARHLLNAIYRFQACFPQLPIKHLKATFSFVLHIHSVFLFFSTLKSVYPFSLCPFDMLLIKKNWRAIVVFYSNMTNCLLLKYDQQMDVRWRFILFIFFFIFLLNRLRTDFIIYLRILHDQQIFLFLAVFEHSVSRSHVFVLNVFKVTVIFRSI